jgi:phytoene dehydrogenase-like protein
MKSHYDVIIVGAGHNGLVASAYLAQAGLSTLVIERLPTLGGASCSARIFPGMEANLSVFAYLISLLPAKIIRELGLRLELIGRHTASWTPVNSVNGFRELILPSRNPEGTQKAIAQFTEGKPDGRGYEKWLQMEAAIQSILWPSLWKPLQSRQSIRERLDGSALQAWQALIEEPLGACLESLIQDDALRGALFTDAKIGVSTHGHDPTLLQNRCFLYHILGQGTGEWLVPVGGMGTLIHELERVNLQTGKVTLRTSCEVTSIEPHQDKVALCLESESGPHWVQAHHLLLNACLPPEVIQGEPIGLPVSEQEGAAFKMNMLLKKLPQLKESQARPEEVFAGTVHLDEGYQAMETSYRESVERKLPKKPPCEIYCHSLSDPSILSAELQTKGFHTLTLFGLDLPYRLFVDDPVAQRNLAAERCLAAINQHLATPIQECLAIDSQGQPCLHAMSALDLENHLRLPKGHLFHGDLSWPFTDQEEQVGKWGVETEHPRIHLCGSSAQRGGAVSGIPGHNAAMCVLERLGHQVGGH